MCIDGLIEAVGKVEAAIAAASRLCILFCHIVCRQVGPASAGKTIQRLFIYSLIITSGQLFFNRGVVSVSF